MLFTKEEEGLILEAIRWAERTTTGEIRIYVEDFCLRDHPVERAEEIFQLFGMFNTKHRNAVLIYLAEKSHHFAIWGDAGIHQMVGFEFWAAEKQILRDHFKEGKFCEGLCHAIKHVGQQLAGFFPEEPGDENELPDEIIYG